MKLFDVLSEEHTIVKPDRSYKVDEENQGWLTYKASTFSEFFDDWHRYGFRVAWFNIVWLWRHYDSHRPE